VTHRPGAPSLVVLSGLCGVVAATVGCGRAGTGAEGADTLFIGVAAAMTEAAAPYLHGVELAVADLNAIRGSSTPPFGVRRPPAEQPTQVSVAIALRDDPSVIGVVGHTGSAQTLEAAPVYGDVARDGAGAVVAITPTATNPLVTRASAWVFRVCPTDLDGARALAAYAADSLGARRAAVVYRNDLFGQGYTRAFSDVFRATGGEVVARDPYLAGITEFEAYALRIARRGADALVVAGGATDAVEITQAVRAAGSRPHVLGTDDLAALTTDSVARRAYPDVRYTAFFVADRAATNEARQFVQRYQARYGVSPDHRAALAYDAATLIGLAARAVGRDRRRIRDHVASTGRERAPHPGVTGPIGFDEHGDVIGKPVLVVPVAR
jgi:branched-chain amino acid transport system substrate-binding protein